MSQHRANELISRKTFLIDRSLVVLLHGRLSQWPRGLRRRSTAACLLRLWVRISQGAWVFVCCECCVLSGRRLCDALITRPEKSYRVWCVVVCDLETSRMRRPWPALGRSATGNKQTETRFLCPLPAYLIFVSIKSAACRGQSQHTEICRHTELTPL